MASSKIVSTNPDLPRASSTSSSLSSFLLSDLPPNTMDDLLKSIYTPKQDIKPPSTNNIDDVWKDIVVGNIHRPPSDEEITLEDFLTKAGAVRDEDVRGVNVNVDVNVNVMPSSHFPLSIPPPPSADVSSSVQPSVTVVKGKRRVVDEPVDKATLQKQRRMIKNRESAARSRERKQAYTSELESLVQQLEEENARLLKEQAERNRQRLKELREGLVPVAEKSKQKRKLRRSNSAQTL